MIFTNKSGKYILLLAFSFGFMSCANWDWALDTEDYTVAYDGHNNSIYLYDSLDYWIYMKAVEIKDDSIKINDIQKIRTPEDSSIKWFCVFNGIWISSIDTPLPVPTPSISLFTKPEHRLPYIIYYYSLSSNTWFQIESNKDFFRCKTFDNQKVIFWSENEILIFDEKLNKKTYSPKLEVYDIAISKDGSLWVATPYGEIYNQVNGTWEFIDVIATDYKYNTSIFIDKDDNLWVASNDKYIYRYSAINFKKEKIFESGLGWGQNFFEDKDGRIWLITNEKLFIQGKDGFQEFSLPFTTDVITSFFITNDNFLMIDTENGLYYLDLNEQTESN